MQLEKMCTNKNRSNMMTKVVPRTKFKLCTKLAGLDS